MFKLRRKRPEIPFDQRITCSVADACAATGLGKDSIYKAMKEGRLESAKIGDRRLILIRSLKKLIGTGARNV